MLLHTCQKMVGMDTSAVHRGGLVQREIREEAPNVMKRDVRSERGESESWRISAMMVEDISTPNI